MRWDAKAIHAAVHGNWPSVLADLGIDEAFLRNRHGPCPACDGTDRFRFDDRHGRGDFFCNGCGAGSGFDLLMRVHGWSFAEARHEVIRVAGLDIGRPGAQLAQRQLPTVEPVKPAKPTARALLLLRTACRPGDVPDVVAYLESRHLWPLQPGCTLRAHAHAEYWHRDDNGRSVCIGKFPALLAPVVDIDNDLAALHVTFIENGRKLSRPGCPPRKQFGKVAGRRGCAVRLMPVAGDELGVAEGIETALAASRLHDHVPVWSALNASLLAKFEPPPGIYRVVVFPDADRAGLESAIKLQEQLDGRCDVNIEIPPPTANDWADDLAEKAAT